MMKFLNKSATVLVAALTLTLCSSLTARAGESLDEAVALVDDDVVLKSELDRRVASVRQDLAARKVKLPSETVLRQQVLDRLITDNVQLQMARRAGVRVSDQELAQIIENIAKENQLSPEQFRLKLASEGLSYELFREDLRNEVLISRVRQGAVARRVFISEQEVQTMMETLASEGESHTEYHLGHILLPIAESASTEEVRETAERAQKLVSKLRDGGDFAELAIANSAGQEALQGGDFGWKTINQLPGLFATAAKTLKPGEVSEPLRSASGLHILKLFDSRGNERVVVQQTHARHILVKPSTILSEEDAEKKIRGLYEQLKAGADFAELAKKNSEDPGSANQGGDLGWANPGMFVPVFEKTMAGLQPNQISEPFRSEFGWHVMQVLERRDDDQTEERKRQQAYRVLQSRKYDEEVESWVREIRDQAFIKIIEKPKAS
ncbi:peptidylprolyl isomerase SurA [Permianibacter sp. IMCC34836]|uniref:peptidylprolyl isomerase SurA n=1 Tax=Permianibacter fluminis TaxID=2738515 RepID=UPI001555ADA2|nr:peptidylprolyl isomerase SurA [Permianibacter fluminis]NQD36278.1 peptidylprolyl isomerase SurA [Permianibacter fluminis]